MPALIIMFKKLYYFISGPTDNFSFEHRIFNINCFTNGFFTAIGLILNLSLGLEKEVIWVSGAGLVFDAALYGTTRIWKRFHPHFIDVFVLMINLLLGYAFFYNSGSQGTIFYMLLVNFFVFMLIARQAQQLRIAFTFLVTLTVLIATEMQHPEWIRPYENSYQRLLDHATLLAYSFLFSGMIVYLFRKDYDREKRMIETQRQELDELYRMSTEKNAYIESLIRELHHRVKNNLQVVSSLLALQSKRLKDENARIALEDGRTRVEAMAMIHQKLLLNNELNSVNMKDYLENLSNSLAESFGFSPETVYTDVQLQDLTMDIDKAVPVGLIVNELVTNAFKHAFRGIKNPKLCVVLKQQDHHLLLEISDNGTGMAKVPEEKNSFGMKLVKTLTEQLEATMKTDHTRGTGYTISIEF